MVILKLSKNNSATKTKVSLGQLFFSFFVFYYFCDISSLKQSIKVIKSIIKNKIIYEFMESPSCII